MTGYLGIDNGLDGGIVGLRADGSVSLAVPMPTLGKQRRTYDLATICEVLTGWKLSHGGGDVFCLLEAAASRPTDGHMQAFKTGRGFGAMEAMLIALHIPYGVARPQAWQKTMFKGTDSKLDTKSRAIQVCQRRLPTLDLKPGRKRVPHTGLADAACMALYALQEPV